MNGVLSPARLKVVGTVAARSDCNAVLPILRSGKRRFSACARSQFESSTDSTAADASDTDPKERRPAPQGKTSAKGNLRPKPQDPKKRPTYVSSWSSSPKDPSWAEKWFVKTKQPKKRLDVWQAKGDRPEWNLEYDLNDPVPEIDDSGYTVLSEYPPMQAVLDSSENALPPVLQHGLDRVLFSPGVHVLEDARTGVHNFPKELKKIMSVHEFDYDALPQYQISSADKVLENIAAKSDCRFYGSTSSLTSVFSQFHFLISKWRRPYSEHLSRTVKPCEFSTTAVMAASIFLRYKPETNTYAIDIDKSNDQDIILMYLGKSMEKQLVSSADEFENYRIGKSHNIPPEDRLDREAYHYTKYKNFLWRSQQDCMDPRLPGAGTFDLKTRAVAAVRYDINYIHDVGKTGYQLRTLQGPVESFESEYRDMIRSAFLKYLLQVRMGRMDGIFVAYHNISKMFGFQYIPRDELDLCIHGPNFKHINNIEFKASMEMFSDLLERTTDEFPKQSLHLLLHLPFSSLATQMKVF
ncbi:mitochondrial protein Pet127-domain-containing protein, partial [Limtongia smithiae]|uniref:mitochondrial protein Pet127-domain-containing protein n=1 Tax=Limtongia smithiae TaxID=1125753 RepID=UPI0034CE07AE